MKTLVQHINEARRVDNLIAQYEILKEYNPTFIRVTDGKRRAMSKTMKMSSISFEELESKISRGEYNIQSGDLAFDVSALDDAKRNDLAYCINKFLYDANNHHIRARRYGEFILVIYVQMFKNLPEIG